ncbi:MAG: DUF917 domain-containing protein [Deltaproteobacteria bacterium]|nr:DUF917 domain-containing protein [Deltaproteobacteria bacterium]
MAELVLAKDRDFDDLVLGATFYGTGGGGTPEEGLRLLKKEAAAGRKITCVPPESIPDDSWTACVSFMGNRAPLTEEQKREMERLGLRAWKYENNLVEAARLLEMHTQCKIGAIVAPELGGANTPGPMAAGINMGLPVVDGDYAGRAVPEVAQATPCLFGKPMFPVASVDKWGNKTILYETINMDMAERLGKMLAVAAFGNTGLALFLLRASEMKKVIISGTITECYVLGKAIREAREADKDPVRAILYSTNGWLLFRGEVVSKTWSVKSGYYVGFHLFSGINQFEGHKYKIWFKNENHIAWYDNEVHVMSPDMICQVDNETGEPITNHELEEGRKIAIIGLGARAVHRQEKTVHKLAPRHYGFDIEYIPIENQMGARKRDSVHE